MNLSTNQVLGFGHLTDISPEKLQALKTLLQHILALSVARDTYAQIIDGMPTRTPFSDEIKRTPSKFRTTIIDSDKTKPTDEAMQMYKDFHFQIAPQDLMIELKLAQNYQDAPSDSRENKLRLLEVAAASVHSLAGMIYASTHEEMNVKPPEPSGGHLRQFHDTDGFYVNFYHTNYKLFEKYPFGLLNVVGYWAEAELFGGVVLFEHDEEGSGITNAFIHPQRASCAFQLSEKQLQDFADLSRASDADKSGGANTFLPFSKELNARMEPTFVRVGEAPLRIYKNRYDSPPVSIIPKGPSCVIMEGDPRAASMKEFMRTVKENGWDKPTGTVSRPSAFQASLWSASPTSEEASSSSSKDGLPSTNKEDK